MDLTQRSAAIADMKWHALQLTTSPVVANYLQRSARRYFIRDSDNLISLVPIITLDQLSLWLPNPGEPTYQTFLFAIGSIIHGYRTDLFRPQLQDSLYEATHLAIACHLLSEGAENRFGCSEGSRRVAAMTHWPEWSRFRKYLGTWPVERVRQWLILSEEQRHRQYESVRVGICNLDERPEEEGGP